MERWEFDFHQEDIKGWTWLSRDLETGTVRSCERVFPTMQTCIADAIANGYGEPAEQGISNRLLRSRADANKKTRRRRAPSEKERGAK